MRPSSRARPWVLAGLVLALAAVVAVVVAALVVPDDRPDAVPQPSATASTGAAIPRSELAGQWSGEGTLTDCAGFDEGCPRTLTLTLMISCPQDPCTVTPVERGEGHPPLRFQDGRYRAAGPVRADVGPTCTGNPTSGLWHLDLAEQDGRLVGRYSESTVQSFDCGATSVAWDVTFART
ncbi:hypothetical protein [Petropleomorpha daqingensis]|uniref:Uncharacterized protein n=1 Tax=Petropleomorpha daqingensis TaxID=2026353 RepID=A0A853CBC6_9ACTN|nr:hypothetical protein [Petropleomorpha daqingensis]NYJ05014.1 hypothetical protein [Petropleomorpha daqingensis]